MFSVEAPEKSSTVPEKTSLQGFFYEVQVTEDIIQSSNPQTPLEPKFKTPVPPQETKKLQVRQNRFVRGVSEAKLTKPQPPKTKPSFVRKLPKSETSKNLHSKELLEKNDLRKLGIFEEASKELSSYALKHHRPKRKDN